MFFDPSLSKRKSRSCASCHKPSLAFTDGLAKNKNLSDDGLILRNTPTLLNAAFQNSQFYDMRSENLEGQSIDVIRHKDEMHGSVDDLIEYLRNDSTYQDLFDKAFPGSRGNIKAMHIQNAIAAYVRSLKSLDSKFDRHMKTDSSILSTDEIAGFNLFMGKAKCATCHFIPLFNGTIPPSFSKTESEVLGVPASKAKGAKVDPDEGRYTIHKMEPLRYAFKTPRCEMLRLQHHICTMVFISRWKK
ncbi:cytochrome-c peroxidase [Chryseosolibacter indicus]|uniref:Cytochrome c domain-containing protein n=1 Tax=Chryseosolibacter indicus TaxID=2782351 RepID=A0ABS5VQ20_9BACT|nr:cytochrome-c peroxidase [Chryseosolibacter indicus]MBT1703226.1 hypothetical protein [Chryseosolibacter indicus]